MPENNSDETRSDFRSRRSTVGGSPWRPVTPVRRAAGWALESLRHIPDAADPPEVQGQDRTELALALETLSARLKDAATSRLR